MVYVAFFVALYATCHCPLALNVVDITKCCIILKLLYQFLCHFPPYASSQNLNIVMNKQCHFYKENSSKIASKAVLLSHYFGKIIVKKVPYTPYIIRCIIYTVHVYDIHALHFLLFYFRKRSRKKLETF